MIIPFFEKWSKSVYIIILALFSGGRNKSVGAGKENTHLEFGRFHLLNSQITY